MQYELITNEYKYDDYFQVISRMQQLMFKFPLDPDFKKERSVLRSYQNNNLLRSLRYIRLSIVKFFKVNMVKI